MLLADGLPGTRPPSGAASWTPPGRLGILSRRVGGPAAPGHETREAA